ncbi:MAG: enoyl-CoA hydratase/isomerase family protein, partial [Syntrophobacterales bacterium]|nr:enoyl-CoA hydratase/isomerase family protein [Syntrophobacterales bacterium]
MAEVIMDFQSILFERKDGVATIRLNRPKNFNAIDFGLGNDLARALEICHDDDGIRVVALTGEGKAFCSGGDLRL